MVSMVVYRAVVMRIPSILLGIFSIVLIALSVGKLSTGNVGSARNLVAPIPNMEKFSFGYAEVLADILWIRALQDFDYCESTGNNNKCRGNSWLYQMLDAITNLSTDFRIPYATGGLALSVLVGDTPGATKFFDKGVTSFPHDWPILYRAAYHYLYEVNDKKKAAELLIQAGKNGAPQWVFTLAGRLYSDSGNLDLAEAMLIEMRKSKQDAILIERLQKKIESIRADNLKR